MDARDASASFSLPTTSSAARPWWRGATGYEVYLRSFADSDGDGTGDLRGVTRHLDHLAELGVDIVWVTPFYPSPMADFGYDVADHRGVDPSFGDLDDVDELVGRAHDLGLRVVFDLVPNHTSDQHPWFRAARSSPLDPHRNWYHWHDPAPDGGPPNNWVSHFGGPAWTLDPASGQYYLHLFLPEQPDLDWSNPEVRDAVDGILRFWLDRGVDGFRIDVAHGLVKDPALRDNPVLAVPGPRATALEQFNSFDHRHDLDQAGVTEVYRRWRTITAPYDALLLGEVYLDDPARLARYVDGALDLSFCFGILHASWDADALRTAVAGGVTHLGDAAAWPISSHDDHRAATRFGGGDAGRRRALAFTTLVAFLPGVLFLYQGDELGLTDGRVALDDAQDPVAVRNGDPAQGRDGVRTPMPWDDGPAFGFTSGRPWLPDGGRRPEDTVTHQSSRTDSFLGRHRELLAVRRQWRDLDDVVEWDDDGLAFRRGPLHVWVNAGDRPLERTAPGDVVYATSGSVRHADGLLRIPPDHAAVVRSW